MTRLIAYELDKLGVGYEYLHGGVPSAKRRDLINNFTDDPDSRVFLSTDAGSTGLNLQAGSIMINLDLPWNPAVLEQRIARIYRLGQERNVQVINLVARGTIEEGMLGKLRFKTAMFEGVLDNGEDTIFLGNETKFTAMMDTLGEVLEEEQQQSTAISSESTAAVPSMSAEGSPCADTADEPEPLKEAPTDTEPAAPSVASVGFPDGESADTPATTVPVGFPDGETGNTPAPSLSSTKIPRHPQELVAQGISFLTGLAQTLQSPEATQQLVDTLVETNTETGESHLRIPVPDKQTVQNLLNFVGKLFNNK
jgi:superfamily II DNA/RNA helicase